MEKAIGTTAPAISARASRPRRSRPLDYRIDCSERLVVITGEYRDPDSWRDLLARMLQDPLLKPGFALLRDRRGTATHVDVATLAGMVDAIGRFWPHIQPSRAAILISRHSGPAAVAASSVAETHGFSIQAFTSYDAARAWLREGLNDQAVSIVDRQTRYEPPMLPSFRG